jgi:hypothetical protein
MKTALPLLALAIVISAFAIFPRAQGQAAGSVVGSETVVYTFSNTTQLNETSFEAKISSNSPFIVSTVLVGTNSSAVPFVSAREWRVYDSSGGEPFVYNSPDGSLPVGSDDEVRAVAGTDALPLGVPEGGELGVKFETSGMEQGDKVTVTFVYTANAGSVATAETSAAERYPAAPLPLYVTENSRPESNSTGLRISDSFVNPEIHCEICTVVDAGEQAEAAYTANATDLSGATKFAFWAMGESGGENVTFKVAGKGQDNEVSFANTTSVALGSEWKRYEVDLAGADLQGITHLFGFETDGEQTFYVKGAVFY